MDVLERDGRLRSLPWAPLVAVVLFVALVAGGLWWGILAGGTDDPPTFEERVRAVDGVSSVTRESDEQRYRATMKGPVRPARIAHVIAGLDKVTDTPQPPGEVVLVVDGVTIYGHDAVTGVFRDVRTGARAIAAAVERPEVESLSFLEGSMRISVEPHHDMLPAAGAVLDTLTQVGGTHHGVDWSTRLEVTDGTRDDHQQLWHLQLGMDDLDATVTWVHRLQRVLHRRDGRLLEADSQGQGDVSTTIRVGSRAQIATVRQDVLSVLPEGSTVAVAVDDLEVSGDRPSTQALGVVRRMEKAGATVSQIAMQQDGRDHLVASVVGGGPTQMKRVLALLGRPGGLASDTWVELTLRRFGSNQDAMQLTGRAGRLSAHGDVLVALCKADYRVVYHDAGSSTTHWPHAAAAVAIHPEGDDADSTIDLSTARDRRSLIELLRASHWPGTLVVQVFGLVDSLDPSDEDSYGLRFASTADGRAHKVLLPGQLTASGRELRHSSALPFVRQWDATAQ